MTKSSHYMTESNPASIKQCTFSPMNMLKNLVKILKTNQTKFSFTLCNKGKDNLALNHFKKKPHNRYMWLTYIDCVGQSFSNF